MTTIKLDTNEFKKVLKRVSENLGGKNGNGKISDILNNNVKVVFNNDCMTFQSAHIVNNLEVNLDGYREINCDKGEFILSDVKNILKSLNFFKGEITIISYEENSDITIQNEDKSIVLSYTPVSDYANKSKDKEYNNVYNYNTKDLYDRLKKLDLFRAESDVRPLIQGINFNGKDMVATDGFRLGLIQDESLTLKDNDKFTIDPITIKLLLKLLDKKDNKDLVLSVSATHIKMEFDNIVLTSRLLEGNFMDYRNVFRERNGHEFTMQQNTKELIDSLKFLNTFSKESKNRVIRYEINNGIVEIMADSEKGNYKSKLNGELIGFDDDEFKLAFNGQYMQEMLSIIDSKDITLGFMSAVTPIFIEISENERYLLLPVRLT